MKAFRLIHTTSVKYNGLLWRLAKAILIIRTNTFNATEPDAFRLRSGADEVLLVNEVGLITDPTFSNLLFRRSGEQWETPDLPLAARGNASVSA